MLAALALLAADAYLTRILGAAGTTIQHELGLSDEAMGFILGGFALGYLWFQIPGGWLGNRLGPRVVLPTITILWCLCTLWASIVSSGSGLRYSRIALGLTQAGLVPCCMKVLADWYPLARRGTASAVLSGSMQAGAVLASGLTATLLPSLGWRKVLRAYSSIGILWAVAFYVWFRNRPDKHPSTNQAEVTLILSRDPVRVRADGDTNLSQDRPDGIKNRDSSLPPVSHLLKHRSTLALITSVSMWAICGQAFFRNFGYEFFTTWFPAYLERAHGVKTVQAGMFTMVPLVGVGFDAYWEDT